MITNLMTENWQAQLNKVFFKRMQNDFHIFVINLDPVYEGPDNVLNGRIFFTCVSSLHAEPWKFCYNLH